MMAEVDVPDVGLNASIVVDPTLGDENGQITIVECTPEDRESLLEISGTGEPASKRMKLDDDNFLRVSDSASIKQILFNINQAICLRLDAIETKLEMVSSSTKLLEERLDQLCTGGAPGHRPSPGEGGLDGKATTPTHNSVGNNSGAGTSLLASTPGKEPGTPGLLSHRKHNSGAVVVGLPTTVKQHIKSSGGSVDSKDGDEDDAEERYVVNLAGSNNMASDENVQSLGPNVTLITLNSEEDFPSGTWLGDENNPEMRVRVPISPSDLLHIHSNCRTAEKMALTLLDYLFDRETQAYSNLSGMGKHGKKQLDPLMIYGVRCHLIHHFNVSEQDWHRIKQNINSKCRTAFRRKVRGLPLTVKSFRGKAPPTYVHIPTQGLPGHHRIHDLGDTSDDSMNQGDESELQIQTEVDVSQASLIPATTSEILQSSGGHIQVLHATPEQVAQLQQTHQIQILQGDQIMQFHTGETQDSVHVAVPMSRGDVEAIQIVNSDVEGAETIHLPPGALGHDVTAEMVGHQGLKVEADTGDSDH